MTESEITRLALTARSRLSSEERRKLESEAEQFVQLHQGWTKKSALARLINSKNH